MPKKHATKLTHLFKTKFNAIAAVFAAVIVLGAGYVVLRSYASGFFAVVEPENGTVSGGAQIVNDAGASGGKAVLFTSPPTPAPTPPPTPTPTPTPSPTAVCPAFPAFPDDNCTGYAHTGVTLQTYTGPMTVTTPGTVIEGKKIVGTLCIMASNVTVRKSKIEGVIRVNDESGGGCSNASISITNVLIEDVEVAGPGTSVSSTVASRAVYGSNFTCRRCNVHRWGSGFYVWRNVLIEDSYVHDTIGDDAAHRTCIGGNGAINATYRHNNLKCLSLNGKGGISGAMVAYSDPLKFLPAQNVLMEKNLLAVQPGSSYCLYAGVEKTEGALPRPSNVQVIDNRFERGSSGKCGQYGPYLAGDVGVTLSGNAYTDGTPIP